MSHIKLSLIIATYNRAERLERALGSLSAQTLPAELWEVVVVNNNSSDDTLVRFARFVAAHPELNAHIFTETRQGVSHARNRAIIESRGEYIAVIDDDETVNAGFLKEYYDFFEAYPHAAAAGGRIRPQYEVAPPKWLSPRTIRPIVGTIDLGDKIIPFSHGRFFGGGNMGLRRTAIDKYGVFDPALGRTGTSLMAGEEKELFYRLKDAGEQIYYLPNAIINHIIPPERLTREYFTRLCSLIGRSERVRTLNRSRVAYCKRLFMECIKWGGAMALALGYLLRLQSAKSQYLIIMRWNITKGLLVR
jgi:glycosyltransferase involved in cell wall biosynthesis